MKTETKYATKIEVLRDSRVDIDFSSKLFSSVSALQTNEDRLKVNQEIASELQDLLRSHREWSRVQVFVVPEYEAACSLCGERWDPVVDEDDKTWLCGHCGAPVDVAAPERRIE